MLNLLYSQLLAYWLGVAHLVPGQSDRSFALEKSLLPFRFKRVELHVDDVCLFRLFVFFLLLLPGSNVVKQSKTMMAQTLQTLPASSTCFLRYVGNLAIPCEKDQTRKPSAAGPLPLPQPFPPLPRPSRPSHPFHPHPLLLLLVRREQKRYGEPTR